MPKEKEEKDGRNTEEPRGQHVWGGELGDSHDGIISCIIGITSRAVVSEVAAPHPPTVPHPSLQISYRSKKEDDWNQFRIPPLANCMTIKIIKYSAFISPAT